MLTLCHAIIPMYWYLVFILLGVQFLSLFNVTYNYPSFENCVMIHVLVKVAIAEQGHMQHFPSVECSETGQ